jgi:hypothetical protein
MQTTLEGTLKKLFKTESNSPLKAEKVKAKLKSVAIKAALPWMEVALKEINRLSADCKLDKKKGGEIVEALYADMDKLVEEKQAFMQKLGFDTCEDKEMKAFAETLSFAELLGLDLEMTKRGANKEKKLIEFVGMGCASAIKNAVRSGLIERLSSSDPFIKNAALEEAKGIIESATSSMKENQFVQWSLLITGVLGVIATVLAFIFTGGVGAAVMGGLFLACALAMLLADVASMRAAHEVSAPIGKWDRWLLGANTAVCAVSLVAVIVLSSVFSMGAAPLAIALVIGILWLANNMYAHVRLEQRRQRFEKGFPTMASLQKQISKIEDDKQIDTEILNKIKKLPKGIKKALKMESARLFGLEHPFKKVLSKEDQRLDTEYNFGYEFFMRNTGDADVLRAVQKACETLQTESVRGLYERLKSLTGQGISEEEVRKFFVEHLNEKEKELIAQFIYNKRAKKNLSKHFTQISINELKSALHNVSQFAKIARKEKQEMLWQRTVHAIVHLTG